MGLMRNAPAPLALDFAARRRRPGWLGWLALALGAVALVLALLDVQAARARLAEAEHRVERAREAQRAARAGARAVAPAPPLEALEAAHKVAGELDAPWARVFGDVANARIDGLALLELHGDAARGSLRLVGVARSLAVAFDYAELLQADGALRDVRIDSHEWIVAGNADVVRFTVSATWGAR
jgi:hypothetical protein